MHYRNIRHQLQGKEILCTVMYDDIQTVAVLMDTFLRIFFSSSQIAHWTPLGKYGTPL